ncbi:MAG: OmpH family outer membrane protein [Ignavibacteriae bacterium]|nr:OmpH family outer membrane protein [Ignavibacteriota bacterium]
MNKLVVSILAVVALMIGAANAQQKIAYVNSTKIFQEVPEAQDAQKRLEALAKPVQDEIEKQEKAIQDKVDEYKKKESLLNDAAKKTAQQEIYDLDQKLREYKLQKLGQDGELAKQQDRILNPIKEKILKAIEVVAKAEKYTFVFDQTESVRVLLYGDPKEDLTNRVIDRLKRGK